MLKTDPGVITHQHLSNPVGAKEAKPFAFPLTSHYVGVTEKDFIPLSEVLDSELEEMEDASHYAPWSWSDLGQATSLGMSVSSSVKENRSCVLEAICMSHSAFHTEMNLILVSIPSSPFST